MHHGVKQSVFCTIIVIAAVVCEVKQRVEQQGLRLGADLITPSVL